MLSVVIRMRKKEEIPKDKLEFTTSWDTTKFIKYFKINSMACCVKIRFQHIIVIYKWMSIKKMDLSFLAILNQS